MINGKHQNQYNYCRDYTVALKMWNTRSSAKIAKEGDFFQRMYVCLKACKIGFLAGCRPVKSMDACHLKGPLGFNFFVRSKKMQMTICFSSPILFARTSVKLRGHSF